MCVVRGRGGDGDGGSGATDRETARGGEARERLRAVPAARPRPPPSPNPPAGRLETRPTGRVHARDVIRAFRRADARYRTPEQARLAPV